MPPSTFSELLSHLDATGIATPADLKGCTPQELEDLETRYKLVLPDSYRYFLTKMGHRSGRLFTHDHYSAGYEHVRHMTAEYLEDCDQFPDEKHVELPPDSLIIVGRLSEQFLMIRCNDPEDSTVWYFNEYDFELRQAYSSVLEWLCSTADEAKRAIDRGYYDMLSQETQP